MRRPNKRIVAFAVTLCMIVALIPLTAVPAFAANDSSRSSKISEQIDKLTDRLDSIADRFDSASDQLDAITEKIEDALLPDSLLPSKTTTSPSPSVSPSPSESAESEESPDAEESPTPSPSETAQPAPSEASGKLPFTDVSTDDYYYDAVAWAVENTITAGTSKTTFGPGESCTRAQVMVFLWRANGSPSATIRNNPFKDVAEDSYYYDAVRWAVSKGITSGTSSDTFSPDDTCTRAQVVTFLWRAKNTPDIGTDKLAFTDVPEDAYYHDPGCWAVNNVITAGTSKTTFSPDDTCTRAQVMVFLWRAYGM